MATGSVTDILSRIKAVLPGGWFPVPNADGTTNTPILDGVLTGCAWAWSWCYGLIAAVRLLARRLTASGVFLDMYSADFFGTFLPRRTGETDALFNVRIGNELFREKGTRAGLVKALTDLTGRTPAVFEPAYPLDTGGYGASGLPYNGLSWLSSRTTPGTYIDQAGVLQTVGPGAARPLYVGSILSGVLSEPAATNIATSSANITGTGWTNRSAPAFTTGHTAPDGSNNAVLQAYPSNTGSIYDSVFFFGGVNNITYTYSVFAKDAGNGWLHTQIWDFGTGATGGAEAFFNLATGALGSVNVQGASTATAVITSIGNGWYRCSLTAKLASNPTLNLSVDNRLSTANNDNGGTPTVGKGTILWGAQIEVGSGATSYIATTTTTATRAADVLTSSRELGGGLAYGTAGGYGSLALPFQFFVTAYRPTGQSVATVAGYGHIGGFNGMPGGYGAGAAEYANPSMFVPPVSDAEILAVINDVRPIASIAWTRIEGASPIGAGIYDQSTYGAALYG